jgi:hypothetical protein
MKRFLRRPSPAMSVAMLALFVAMAGSAYAATVITGANVKNGSLTGRDIRSSSLQGSDVKNGALAARDIKAGSLTADRFRSGDLPRGPKGDQGVPGNPAGQTRWALVNEAGAIEEQSGGFTVVSRPGINGQPLTNPNIYINAGSSLVGKGLSVSTAIQNRIDRSTPADGTADPAFSGDTAVGRCNSAPINCVPAGTNTDSTLVVRSLVTNTDVTSQTRRFYVHVTP